MNKKDLGQLQKTCGQTMFETLYAKSIGEKVMQDLKEASFQKISYFNLLSYDEKDNILWYRNHMIHSQVR